MTQRMAQEVFIITDDDISLRIHTFMCMPFHMLCSMLFLILSQIFNILPVAIRKLVGAESILVQISWVARSVLTAVLGMVISLY